MFDYWWNDVLCWESILLFSYECIRYKRFNIDIVITIICSLVVKLSIIKQRVVTSDQLPQSVIHVSS